VPSTQPLRPGAALTRAGLGYRWCRLRLRLRDPKHYPDIGDAIDWLCKAFGFTLRIRIADHRTQLNVGDGGAVVLIERSADVSLRTAVMVRVEDVNAHYERASLDFHGPSDGWSPAGPTGRNPRQLGRC
jgi:hypothetical protein